MSRDWLYKVLGANDMLLRKKKTYRPPRTTMGVVNQAFEDHLNTTPKYIPTGHGMLFVSDITYLKTKEGFLYLSLTMDAYSRIITGFSLQRTLTTDGSLEALDQTVAFCRQHKTDLSGAIFHSDRGSRYVSSRMTNYQAESGMITRVTQTGDSLHNAMAERLNGTIKNDWLYNYESLSFEETQKRIAESIKLYNTARPHRAIGMIPPMQMLLPQHQNPLTKRTNVA